MIRDPDESWYLRQEGTGVIVGPYEHNGIPWSIDGVPSDFGMELLPPDLGRVQDIVAMAMKRVPAAADGGLKRIVNHGQFSIELSKGLDAVSDDVLMQYRHHR